MHATERPSRPHTLDGANTVQACLQAVAQEQRWKKEGEALITYLAPCSRRIIVDITVLEVETDETGGDDDAGGWWEPWRRGWVAGTVA